MPERDSLVDVLASLSQPWTPLVTRHEPLVLGHWIAQDIDLIYFQRAAKIAEVHFALTLQFSAHRPFGCYTSTLLSGHAET
jgi:hypothetical protein